MVLSGRCGLRANDTDRLFQGTANGSNVVGECEVILSTHEQVLVFFIWLPPPEQLPSG